MGKYQDINCPICDKPLENGEPIAICPDCGAPYHKACIEETKKCIFEDLHAQGKSWEAPKKETKQEAPQPKRCPRCGSENPPEGIFCEVCGTMLNSQTNQNTAQNYRPNINDPRPNMGNMGNTGTPPFGFPGQMQGSNQTPGTNQMPFGVFVSPFGGVKPDEKIDDIPVQEWAIFLGQNAHYYIPKFKAFSEKKKSFSFNFSAMFFNGLYFLYRKMNLLGVLILLLTLVLQIPALLVNYDTLRYSLDPSVDPLFTTDTMINIANIFSIIRLVVSILCGLFANRLYKNHCVEKITKIKKEHPDHGEYVQSLAKAGSVSKTVILVLIVAYFVFSFILSYLTVSQLM